MDNKAQGYLFKRSLDFMLGITGLFFSFPLWIIFGLAVWLEDFGPVFFRQERVGLRGKFFFSWKFRSMIKDAEKNTGPIQARENDPRMTKIGRLLRRSAIDELPQLWNIVKGQMSFVGPRPLRPQEIEVHPQSHNPSNTGSSEELRNSIKPGLTGVAQVFASRVVQREEKYKYDLWYIQHQGLLLDIKLIAMSFWISFSRKWDTAQKGFSEGSVV